MTTAKSDVFIAFDFWREGNKNLVGGVYWRGIVPVGGMSKFLADVGNPPFPQ